MKIDMYIQESVGQGDDTKLRGHQDTKGYKIFLILPLLFHWLVWHHFLKFIFLSVYHGKFLK